MAEPLEHAPPKRPSPQPERAWPAGAPADAEPPQSANQNRGVWRRLPRWLMDLLRRAR